MNPLFRFTLRGLALMVWAGAALLHAQETNDAASSPAPLWSKPAAPSIPGMTNETVAPLPPPHPAPMSGALNKPGLSLNPNTTPESPLPSPGEPLAATPTVPTPSQDDLADHLLVVYNQTDPDSQQLALYYAAKRHIPDERVFGISCPTREEITRQQYEDTIRQPIVSYLIQQGWLQRQNSTVSLGNRTVQLLVASNNNIWAIVLMRGVPLKIAPDPSDSDSMQPQPVFRTDAAAVDSELALLPIYGLPKGGFVPNIYYDNQTPALGRVGPDLARNIVLVTRLDAPKASDVRRMIDDTLFAEQNRLAGLAVIDTRGITNPADNYILPDIWLRSAREILLKDGWLVKFDSKPDVLPPTDPCNRIALYLGWYRADAWGPFATPPDRFTRGAIAYHLHSFSAVTMRDDQHGWTGALVAHGASATMGTVYEPYLEFTPHLDIFCRRLLEGQYFCEAAYASQRGLSWMTTVVGDPLYRPFRVSLADAIAGIKGPHTPHDDWLLLQQFLRQAGPDRAEIPLDTLQKTFAGENSGPVAYEALGDLLLLSKDPQAGPAAEKAYRAALPYIKQPIDRIRLGLKLAAYYASHGQPGMAEAEKATLCTLYPEEAKTFGLTPVLPPGTSERGTSPSAAR